MPRARTGKRKQQAAETRARIYDAAIREIERHGFENATIGGICKAAGVSVGAFYTHFPSKADIIHEIFRKGDRHFEEVVARQLTEARATARIKAYFHHYAAFNAGNGIEFVRVLYRGFSPEFTDRDRFMLRLLRRLVEEGQSARELDAARSADGIVDDLLLIARGRIFDWCVREGEYDLVAAMDRTMALFLPALAPKP
jgi:TetR/AcrR family transcriptional regulator, fatty acid metabolism regulator protein